MSERNPQDKGLQERRPGGSFQKRPYNREGQGSRSPQPARGPYGRPAGDARPGANPERKYGRPAGDARPGANPERKYGRPAGDARPGANPERKYGRPAGDARPGANPERKYGRPAGDARPGIGTERKYGRPAGDARPGPNPERKYGHPAGDARPGANPERKYGRPAPQPATDSPRPFARPAEGERRFARPAGPAFNRPGLRPARGVSPVKPLAPVRQEPILSKDARVAALLVLNRVLNDGAYASLTLDEIFQNMRLSQQDKRLAAAIVYKTTEDLIKIDFALGRFLQDAEALNGKIRNILRLSACQILLMDKIPDFAAVNEAVELTRASGLEDMTGLVNGVLRSLIRAKDELPWPAEGDADYLSVTYSIPQWLAEEITASYPADISRDILAYRNPDHAITLRRNQSLVTQAEFEAILAKKTWEKVPGLLPEVFKVRGASDIGKDMDFLGGKFSIQGEGSMLAAQALTPKVGMTVLDCCAAPGGKTCYLAELMQNTGRVHAWDVHEHRVDLIYAQAERLRLYNVRPAVRDAAVYQERFDSTMDAVLLDAPCTGTGVMDNKPDLKYRLTPEGLEELAALQARLLETNSRYVKPGGVLVYSTCSVLPRENEQQIQAFLNKHQEFALDSLPESFPSQFSQHQGPFGLQLLPHRDGVEGFFIARMKRK